MTENTFELNFKSQILIISRLIMQLLANEKHLSEVIEKMLQENRGEKERQRSTELIRGFLEENGKEMGMPTSETNEAVDLLYDAVFADVDNEKSATEIEKNEFVVLVKEIFANFAEQLEANPVFHELDN